jgi:hypothetical protein
MLKKQQIEEALEKHWNIRPASEELGVGYSTLRKYIKIYNIQHDSRKKRNGPTFNRNAWQSKAVTKARQNKKLKALEYRGGMKCTRCGFDEPIPDCYAFHHRDPSIKDINWGKMKQNNWSFEKIKEELDKCDVLCHNCHSIIHYLERQ